MKRLSSSQGKWLATCVFALLVFSGCRAFAAEKQDTLPATMTPTMIATATVVASPTPVFATSPTPADQLAFGVTSFVGNRNILVKVDQQVQLIDPLTTGGTHFVVTGKNGIYTPEIGAPEQLETANGMPIRPGQTITLTFSQPGTYTLTCLPHPGMLAQITVTQ